jgi:hypothetical protein
MNHEEPDMTMSELHEMLAQELPPAKIEKVVEDLIAKGMVETLWDADGNVSYRLTAIGRVVGKAINDQYQYDMEQHDGWMGDGWDDEGWDDGEI